MSTGSLVTALLNARSEFGGGGATALAWNHTSGVASDIAGNVFQFSIEVFQNENLIGHVISVDVREIFPKLFPVSKYTSRQGHSMFVETSCGNNVFQIRNSWGKNLEKIKIDLNKVQDKKVFYVEVTNLIWQPTGHEEDDIDIILDKKKLTPSKWPIYKLKR